jgi:hypothetical protein
VPASGATFTLAASDPAEADLLRQGGAAWFGIERLGLARMEDVGAAIADAGLVAAVERILAEQGCRAARSGTWATGTSTELHVPRDDPGSGRIDVPDRRMRRQRSPWRLQSPAEHGIGVAKRTGSSAGAR